MKAISSFLHPLSVKKSIRCILDESRVPSDATAAYNASIVEKWLVEVDSAPFSQDDGTATLTARVPGWYIVVYNSVNKDPNQQHRLTKFNQVHLFDILSQVNILTCGCTRDFAGSGLFFVPAPMIVHHGISNNVKAMAGKDSRDSICVRMGKEIVGLILNVHSPHQKGHLIIQRAQQNDSLGSSTHLSIENADEVAVCTPDNPTVKLDEGQYYATMYAKPAGEGKSDIFCSTNKLTVGMYHSPGSAILEAMQFQSNFPKQDNINRMQVASRHCSREFGFETVKVCGDISTWVDTSVSCHMKETKVCELLRISAGQSWRQKIAQMKQVVVESSDDEETKYQLLRDLKARVEILGLYSPQNNSEGIIQQYIHQNGRIRMQMCKDNNEVNFSKSGL